jgi:hydroxymethylbilane synthase
MSDRAKLKIGARPSVLAMTQARQIADRLRSAAPETNVEIVPIRTSGDRLNTAALAAIGGKGLFIRELEGALARQQIDIAVHSLKDLPALLDPRFRIAAVPPREDRRDALVSRIGVGIEGLPPGACVGTASTRRRFELLRARPDLRVTALRGNVDTRLAKLAAGEFDAIMVAMAGLRRLGRDGAAGLSPLDEGDFVPAGGQGALAVEALADRLIGESGELEQAVSQLDDAVARCETAAERSFLATIGASCATPVGVSARAADNQCAIRALLFSPDGHLALADQIKVDLENLSEPAAAAAGARLGAMMLARGAAEMIAQ